MYLLTADAAIRKMVATLDDPFTRFLEPKKFKSLRVQASCSHISAITHLSSLILIELFRTEHFLDF